MKERLPNSSPAPEPGKPSLDTIAQLHAGLRRRAMRYLRCGDSATRQSAARMLCILRRRLRGCA